MFCFRKKNSRGRCTFPTWKLEVTFASFTWSPAWDGDWIMTKNVRDGKPGSLHQTPVSKQKSGMEKLWAKGRDGCCGGWGPTCASTCRHCRLIHSEAVEELEPYNLGNANEKFKSYWKRASSWVSFWILLLTISVNLGEILTMPKPYFLHLW